MWHALADLASYGEWNPYVVRADGEATVGAVVQITAHPTGDAETTYPITVLEVEPPSDGAARMVWEGGHADAVQFRTEHIWELTTTDDGTHVHHHEYFRGALQSDPRFADAYFNLAMAYEQTGEADKAKPCWRKYLDIEPSGTWAEIARKHL